LHNYIYLNFILIRIGHDNKGIGAAWHLNEVIIESTNEDKKWIFPANRWIAGYIFWKKK
jgi:hypothetical protein